MYTYMYIKKAISMEALSFFFCVACFFYKFSTLGSNDNESICTVSDSITWPARKKKTHIRVVFMLS